MRYRFLIAMFLLAAATAGLRTASAQMFYAPPGWQQQAAVLNFLAAQALRNNHAFTARDTCHPARDSYESGYGSPGSDYADLRLQAELAETRAFWEKRRLRREYMEAEREARRVTMQDVETARAHHEASLAMMALNREIAEARCARQSPGRPELREVNPVSGEIRWPTALRSRHFVTERDRLESIFAQRAAYGDEAWESSSAIPALAREMRYELKSMVRSLPSSDYVAAKNFLNKLEYESRFTPPGEGLASK